MGACADHNIAAAAAAHTWEFEPRAAVVDGLHLAIAGALPSHHLHAADVCGGSSSRSRHVAMAQLQAVRCKQAELQGGWHAVLTFVLQEVAVDNAIACDGSGRRSKALGSHAHS